jgi:hypothetical protein
VPLDSCDLPPHWCGPRLGLHWLLVLYAFHVLACVIICLLRSVKWLLPWPVSILCLDFWFAFLWSDLLTWWTLITWLWLCWFCLNWVCAISKFVYWYMSTKLLILWLGCLWIWLFISFVLNTSKLVLQWPSSHPQTELFSLAHWLGTAMSLNCADLSFAMSGYWACFWFCGY